MIADGGGPYVREPGVGETPTPRCVRQARANARVVEVSR